MHNVFNLIVSIESFSFSCLPNDFDLPYLNDAIPPSGIDKFQSGINRFKSICLVLPKPLHTGHAPYGALNEKILGSNSGKLKSHSGQA